MQFESPVNETNKDRSIAQGREISEDAIHSFNDEELLLSLENLFALERRLTRTILIHLKEVETRRLYAKRGYPNMFWMLIKHFKQSESAANQRLKALELMLAVPVVEERLMSGDLNLSTLAMAQRQIAREEKITHKKLSKKEKSEIVESITSKTMAEAEIELFKHLPESASSPETVERRVSEAGVRMGLTFPNQVHANMLRLQELWAHVDPNMDPVEVIARSFEIALDKVDPLRIKARSEKRKTSTRKKSAKQSASTQRFADSAKRCVSNKPSNVRAGFENIETPIAANSIIKVSIKTANKHPTYYKRELDRLLWQRAGGQCEWVDLLTAKRCDCSFGIQREHVIPLALGGTNELSNLQLLCRTHNLLRARQAFGDKKIDRHQKRK